MTFVFPPVFCHVRESGGIQPPPRQKVFTAQGTGSCNSLALNFGWCWLLLILSALSDNSLICSSDSSGGERLPTCHRRVSAGSIPTSKPSHRESFLCRGHSVWITRQSSQSSCLCKAGLSRHPRIAFGGEDLRMALGQPHRPFCHPNLPAHPSHQGSTAPGIRGSKNYTKPPLPHLNMTYAKSSLAGAEDQGPFRHS